MNRPLIVLAAGQGTRLRPFTDDRPKCLVGVAGRPILERVLDVAYRCGIKKVVVVGGYRAERIAAYDVELVINQNFRTTNMVRSLFCAEAFFGEGFILSYGDIFYSSAVLGAAMDARNPISVVVDTAWESYWRRRFDNPLLDAETLRIRSNSIVEIGGKPESLLQIEAQYIGLMSFTAEGVEALRKTMRAAEQEEANGALRFRGAPSIDAMYMTDFLQGMVDRGTRISPVKIAGGWAEIDSASDLSLAETLMLEGRFEPNA
jgi:L-glutamine-phosphate cytidylyltransferase